MRNRPRVHVLCQCRRDIQQRRKQTQSKKRASYACLTPLQRGEHRQQRTADRAGEQPEQHVRIRKLKPLANQ